MSGILKICLWIVCGQNIRNNSRNVSHRFTKLVFVSHTSQKILTTYTYFFLTIYFISAQNHCNPNPCIHGNCINTANSFVCACSHGYTGVTCDKSEETYFYLFFYLFKQHVLPVFVSKLFSRRSTLLKFVNVYFQSNAGLAIYFPII